jgi:hypothetical protein
MGKMLFVVAALMAGCALDDRGDRGDDGITVTPPGDPPPSNGNCPTGETCSDQTPNGLSFVGAQPVFLPFPNGVITNINHQIAVGGTDVIDIQAAGKDFALPFTAVSQYDTDLHISNTTGAKVSLTAAQASTTYLRILDPSGELYDREAYASNSISELLAVPSTEQVTASGGGTGSAATSFVFATGTHTIGIALLDAGYPQHRLIDTSLTLAATGSTQARWDAIKLVAPTAGHYAVAATSGGSTRMVDVEVVDKVDAITTLSSQGAIACFAATVHGSFVANLAWKYTVNGIDVAPYNDLSPNCVADIFANPGFTVTATAGGQSVTITTM